MKALQSKLAAQLLADPVAREQLRSFLANKRTDVTAERRGNGQFLIRSGKGTLSVEAVVVPKAATAG